MLLAQPLGALGAELQPELQICSQQALGRWGVSVVRYHLLLPSQVAMELSAIEEAVLCPAPQNQESLKRALMAFFKKAFWQVNTSTVSAGRRSDICAGHRPGPVDISAHRAS